jgi:uncharacterized repeat protein (TIGR03803 family)
LYGTTQTGGTHAGGTIFKITPSGMLTTMYSFTSTDGSAPDGTLIQATDGSFYGTTRGGGGGYGTVFKFVSSGMLTMRAFSGGNISWKPR